MGRLGPFERRPQVAIAVSGGADSMALCLLAHRWARAAAGEAVALTVDHGLRSEAGAEARRVGAWLHRRRIPHHVLRWRGEKPSANIQAVARHARYELLNRWCVRDGRLHLLLAHHLDDQAETFILRLGRGSGVDGLAAMAPVSELPQLRLLRPFLRILGDRLVATLQASGQEWIDDPSNRDPAHARVRVRAVLGNLGPEGLATPRLAATARRMARARAALDRDTAQLLARAVDIFAAGFCIVDHPALAGASQEVGLRALAHVIRTIGGGIYAPRFERLERLHCTIAKYDAARTLGGCRIVPLKGRPAGRVLVCREPAAAAETIPVGPGDRLSWDRRFTFVIGRRPGPSLVVRRLGREGWSQVAAKEPAVRGTTIPAPVRPSLPAFWHGDRVVCVPHLENAADAAQPDYPHVREMFFEPEHPLFGAAFAVV